MMYSISLNSWRPMPPCGNPQLLHEDTNNAKETTNTQVLPSQYHLTFSKPCFLVFGNKPFAVVTISKHLVRLRNGSDDNNLLPLVLYFIDESSGMELLLSLVA